MILCFIQKWEQCPWMYMSSTVENLQVTTRADAVTTVYCLEIQQVLLIIHNLAEIIRSKISTQKAKVPIIRSATMAGRFKQLGNKSQERVRSQRSCVLQAV